MALVGFYVATWLPVFVPLVHLVAFAEDIGLSRGVGAAALSVLGAGSLVGRIVLGALSDRVGRRPVLALALVLQAAGFIVLVVTNGPTLLMTAAAVFGLGSGAVVGLLPAVVADLFGSAHAASLIGVILAAAALPIALGPWFGGWVFDVSGTYASVFLAGATVNLVGLGLLLPVRSPRISN